MNTSQPEFENGPDYPEPFESGWMSCGSRTIDNGMHFTIEVDSSGFHARKELGLWSVSDLFGEMGWWPSDQLWESKNERLLGLLEDLAPTAGVTPSTLFEMVRAHFVEVECIDIDAHLEEACSNALPPENLSEVNCLLLGKHLISGLPSDDFAIGSKYRGLELTYDVDGWSAVLFGPNECDPYFLPECWDGDTLREILSPLPDDVVQLLLESDPRWKHLLDTDFTFAEEPEPKTPENYTRKVSNIDWEKSEPVVLVSESGDVSGDTLVIGRRPTAEEESEYYMHLSNTQVTPLTSGANGYGGKVIHEMKKKLIRELAQKGISLSRGA